MGEDSFELSVMQFEAGMIEALINSIRCRWEMYVADAGEQAALQKDMWDELEGLEKDLKKIKRKLRDA